MKKIFYVILFLCVQKTWAQQSKPIVIKGGEKHLDVSQVPMPTPEEPDTFAVATQNDPKEQLLQLLNTPEIFLGTEDRKDAVP